MTVSFSAMMGSGSSPEQAKGFDALGMFGKSHAIDAPMTPVGDQRGLLPDHLPTTAGQAVVAVEAGFAGPLPGSRPVVLPAATRLAEAVGQPDLKRLQSGPKAQPSPDRAELLAVANESDPDSVTTPQDRRGTATRSDLRGWPGPAGLGGVNVRLIETPHGTTVALSGGVHPGVVEGFRDAAQRLMARQGQTLYKFVVNGEDRSTGRAEEGFRSWR